MKTLNRYAVAAAVAAALTLGSTASADAFVCHALGPGQVYMYGDGPGQGPVDWLMNPGDAFYGQLTQNVGGVFWSYGTTPGNSTAYWVRTNRLNCNP